MQGDEAAKHEAAHDAAAHKAAQLHNVGWEQGAGAAIWARAVGPRAEAIRDLVAHLDEYATGTGWRQTKQAQPRIEDPYLSTFLYWTNGGGTLLNLGDEGLNLRAAAAAAVRLAEVVERVRAKHLARVEQEANAAFRRRWGIEQ